MFLDEVTASATQEYKALDKFFPDCCLEFWAKCLHTITSNIPMHEKSIDAILNSFN